jgi:hypothetical protein
MATQRERQEFLWRPNDNSSTTNLRYDLEASKWMSAIKSNEIKANSYRTPAQVFGFIGLIIGFIFGVLYLILSGISELFKTEPKMYNPEDNTISWEGIRKLNKEADENLVTSEEEANEIFGDPNIETIVV